ncbi:hypothetical protein [Guptibacillus hwajinpoensis]|uniref:hypothetical protein n=1 Tax=Guptibacillus hwajinpoensis TaxID=208199 RepID=UPI0037370997
MDMRSGLTIERVLLLLFVILLVFFQRLGVTVSGMVVPLLFCLGLPIILILFLFNRLVLDTKKFFLFVIALCCLLLSSVYSMFATTSFSLTSLLFLLAFYLPIIFTYKDQRHFHFLLKSFQGVVVAITLIGIFQFLFQFVGGFIDPFESLPPTVMLQGYNTHIPLVFGSPIFKSHGMFLLEPSFYSKFIATAIIIEFFYFKRMKIIILFVIGILFGFSGTGFILLLLAALPILFQMKAKQLVPIFILSLVPIYFFLTSDFGELMLGRVGEFTNPESSAYIRFVAPYLAYGEFFQTQQLSTVLFGIGPGTLDAYEGVTYTFGENSPLKQAHSLAFIKLLIEYGLLGGAAFSILITYSFVANAPNRVLSFCMFVNYAILSGALLEAVTFYMCYILIMMFATGESVQEEVAVQKKPPPSQHSLQPLYLIEQRR